MTIDTKSDILRKKKERNMKLQEFFQQVTPKINNGSKFLWDCYGDNSWNVELQSELRNTVSIVYDTITQEIYEIQAWDDKREYRYIDSNYVDIVKQAFTDRNLDFENSIDNNKFIDLEVLQDMIEKSNAIVNDKQYDTRVVIELDLTLEEQEQIKKAAEMLNLTIDQFVEKVLEEKIATTSK